MIRVPISKLEPGMVIGAPVRHPDVADHILLQPGYCMEEETIGHLKRFYIPGVWIRHPGFDFLDSRLNDEVPRTRHRVYHTVKSSFEKISEKVAGAFDPIEYRTVVSDMIMSLVANNDHAIWAQRMLEGDSPLFSHSSNVAYLSLILGMRLKQYIFQQRKVVDYSTATDLTNLGIGAMLHDVGKLEMGFEWFDVHILDEKNVDDEYRTHAERGYKAIQGRIEATASQVVLNHHQRWDGCGFPVPKAREREHRVELLKGERIHVYCRIVAVADAVDVAMASCVREKRPVVEALAQLREPSYAGMFDPLVLDIALRCIPPFPIGSCVQLSDCRQAVVTDLVENEPCKPKVALLHALPGDDNAAAGELDLSEESAPKIVVVDDVEVNSESFYSLPPRAKPILV